MYCRTYPGQSGINPFPMDWGNKDFQLRGPVVVSRGQTTIRRRNGKWICLRSRNMMLTRYVAIGGKTSTCPNVSCNIDLISKLMEDRILFTMHWQLPAMRSR